MIEIERENKNRYIEIERERRRPEVLAHLTALRKWGFGCRLIADRKIRGMDYGKKRRGY